MSIKQARSLRPGDEVHWTDPDLGLGSRTYTIQTIRIRGDIVNLTDVDGDSLECYVWELK